MQNRSPGLKLLFMCVIGFMLIVPLAMVYLLVSDRESQSETAQEAITAGWGGEQTIAGPMLVIPFEAEVTETETVNGQNRCRTVTQRRELFVSPQKQVVRTELQPDYKEYSIYRSVIYDSDTSGEATFTLPDDLSRIDVERSALQFDQAELRFGISDPRGLTDGTSVRVAGEQLALKPGNGPRSTGGAGFSTSVEWDGEGELPVAWTYGLRGSKSFALIPRGGETEWTITSPWQHPSFVGSFLPDNDNREIGSDGFTAKYEGITNLALGEALVSTNEAGPPPSFGMEVPIDRYSAAETMPGGGSKLAAIRLVEPVDLYSQVDRSVKYGFLFIGFTFLAYFMFDVVGGARVASAEYLLTGVGLILFFVMLLAFAEVVGFTLAYLIASGAIIGLLTAYSAAVLGGWRRAGMIGGMLVGLYAAIYVLLSLEAWSLMIGSILLFAALAAVMYATRNVEWSIGQNEREETGYAG
ncbi:cell envelope integrity protein CreD [Erythrobacter sp. HKB08]|uniref:cell envelope integrity protein CreD n=1 Tax=Erythrobacter sp. HKB08 TaxID=2502843 RepID=UPI001EEE5A1D|nr:cell envelope integrity protein CreD [Erythrobacter sp. HKB08]